MKKHILYIVFMLVSLSCFSQEYDLSERLLEKEELEGLCDRVLYLKRNEIYARNGYRFSDEYLQDYFSFQPWYQPIEKDVKLNETELANIALIKRIEDRRKAKYTAIENYFFRLKKAVLYDEKDYVKAVFGKADMEHQKDAMSHMKTLMNKIDPKDINYYKNKGLYETRIDNGFVIQIFSLEIEDDKIILSYSYAAHSQIIEGFTECTTYMSEAEYSYMWNFIIDEENNITYQYLNIAG